MLFVWNFDKFFDRKIIAGYFVPVLVWDVPSVNEIVLPFCKWAAMPPFYRRITNGMKVVFGISVNRFRVLHNDT